MLINLRNALMGGKRLPYDAEVEFLESTGTQYIETGVIPDWNTKLSVTTAATATTEQFMGAIDANTDRFHFSFYSAGLFRGCIGRQQIGMGSADQLIHTFTLDAPNNTVSEDGTSYSVSRAGTVPSVSIWLFGRNSDNPSYVRRIKVRIYSCQIYQNGTLVRDYIPVRKGTVGYLYDRVSGKLFGNAGTGDFVLGPDVVPVEYIESFRGSGGGQYIKTGILATTSTKWEIDIAFTTTTTGQVMGSGYAGSQRFNIGIESSAFRGGFGGGWFTISNTRDTNRHLWRLESLSAAQCEASIDGGAAVSYTSTFSPYSGPILLGRRYETESMTYGARYYGNKIWISGDLVQNLLPVRVGTEGAMMDVLTRRIYRNAGTGAFGYGNDLKYPIPAE
jgi:hypothetical protein